MSRLQEIFYLPSFKLSRFWIGVILLYTCYRYKIYLDYDIHDQNSTNIIELPVYNIMHKMLFRMKSSLTLTANILYISNLFLRFVWAKETKVLYRDGKSIYLSANAHIRELSTSTFSK